MPDAIRRRRGGQRGPGVSESFFRRNSTLSRARFGWRWRTSRGHFFSNSFQFVITVIGSDAASVSTELMMNFWPFGIAAQR